MVATGHFDPEVYAKPYDFHPWRFFDARAVPDQHNAWQHVTVSPWHMGFGYGDHACPGRFFASTEIKILLSHLLVNYEWALESDEDPFWVFEIETMVKQDYMIKLRKRNNL